MLNLGSSFKVKPKVKISLYDRSGGGLGLDNFPRKLDPPFSKCNNLQMMTKLYLKNYACLGKLCCDGRIYVSAR